MGKLSKKFVEALPSTAEILSPAVVGKTLKYHDTTERENRYSTAENAEPIQILVVKDENGQDFNIPAGSFNSLFFDKTGKLPAASVDLDAVASLTNKQEEVIELIETQPKWEGAIKGKAGLEVATDGTAEFNQYKVVGVRLKTRNGVPVMRMEAHTAYDEMKAKADAENARIDANAVFASPIAKKHSKPCSELVTYEYLLQTI